jgi:hypothetical protein
MEPWKCLLAWIHSKLLECGSVSYVADAFFTISLDSFVLMGRREYAYIQIFLKGSTIKQRVAACFCCWNSQIFLKYHLEKFVVFSACFFLFINCLFIVLHHAYLPSLCQWPSLILLFWQVIICWVFWLCTCNSS